MATKVTDELVLEYFFKDADHLPSGLRIVSLQMEPGAAKLQSCELEKDGRVFKLGDSLPDSGEPLPPSDVESWAASALRSFYRNEAA